MYIDLPLNKSKGQGQETSRYDKLCFDTNIRGRYQKVCALISKVFNSIRYHTKHLSCVNVEPIYNYVSSLGAKF